MPQGEYLNGFSTFKIEMVPEFDERDNVDKFLRDVRQNGTESQGESSLFHASAKEQEESFETGSGARWYDLEKVQITGITTFAGMIY